MDSHTAHLIDRLSLHPGRPLLICDVDEVVVRFIDALSDWLRAHQLTLHPDSWRLEGNIRRAVDGAALPPERVHALLERFFSECTAAMPVVQGAAECINRLAARGVQVVMLSNIPHAHARARAQNLRDHGLNFPLLTNQGPKGPAVRALRQKVRHEVAFMDDHPDFLHSASECCAGARKVHLVHFVPDSPFVAHLPPLNAPHVQVRDWRQAERVLTRLLADAPARHAHGPLQTPRG